VGLNIQVGVLAELTAAGEPEGITHFRDQFARINAFLATKGIRPHHEPGPPASPNSWSTDMFGYGGVHELRRVALHLLAGNGVPAASAGRASEDPLATAYWAEKQFATPTPEAMRSPSHPTPWAFRHLLMHSDCSGYYLPINFRFVLLPPANSGIAVPSGSTCSAAAHAFQARRGNPTRDSVSAAVASSKLIRVRPHRREAPRRRGKWLGVAPAWDTYKRTSQHRVVQPAIYQVQTI